MMIQCNVRDQGAVGDGRANDTAAIRAAIARCAEIGGGTVLFPPGDYLCGTLRLESTITLHLAAGAVLRESYQEDIDVTRVGVTAERPHLLVAQGATNIAITGDGEILGRGESSSPGIDREKRGFRTGVIFFRDCKHVRISNIRIRFGDAWTVHLCRCENVFIHGLSILNNTLRMGGNDGLDINSCRNVHISDCHIEAWDDCIVLKAKDMDRAGDATACENIVVNNCTFISGCTALKLGSESVGDIRDIHFSNCVVRQSSVGVGIYLLDGGTVERFTCCNVSMEIVPDNRYRKHVADYNIHVFPICLFVGQRAADSKVGRMRDIVLRDIQAQTSHGAVILGHADGRIENLMIDNLTLRIENSMPFVARNLPCSRGWLENGGRLTSDTSDAAKPPVVTIEPPGDGVEHQPAYLNLTHVTDLNIQNVKIYLPEESADGGVRAGIALDAVEGAVLDDCSAHEADTIVVTRTCRNVTLKHAGAR